MDVNEELKFLGKFNFFFFFFWGGGGGVRGGRVGGGQGGSERRICEKFKKNLFFLGGGVGVGLGRKGQGGCDRRIEVFGKIHKKKIRGGGVGRGQVGGGVGLVGGVRVDVNEELKFLGKFPQKKSGGGVGLVGGGGSGWM